MLYRNREELTILELQNDEENISFDRLKSVMIAKLSNVIYCENNGKLYGIITMGDVQRAYADGKKYVTINTHFTSLNIGENEKARKIFDEKAGINALPILNDNGILTGDWIKWNDLRYKKTNVRSGQSLNHFRQSHIAFVCPRDDLCKKQKIFELCCGELISLGIKVVRVKCDEIVKYVDAVDYILAIDEDEYRALCTLYGFLMQWGKAFIKLCTYAEYCKKLKFYERMDAELEFLNPYLSDIQSKGILILNLVFKQNEYYQKMVEKIQSKWIDIGKIPYSLMQPTMYQGFFGNLYGKDDEEYLAHLYQNVAVESSSGKLKDCKSRFFNVNNGERYTAGQPLNYKRTIYFVGPCFVYGAYVEDRNTIESFLQEKLNRSGYEVKVVNYGSVSHGESASVQMSCVFDIPLTKGDIVILYANDKKLDGIMEINLTDALGGSDVNPYWMIDDPRHCNNKMNERYSDIIFEKIKPFLSENVSVKKERIEFEGDAVKKIYIDRYFSESLISKYNKIGSIVMNCNPFTYGHRYLIEQALNTVDFLIIFVVEEDRSVFSFDERFAMVCEGVTGLENVMVVPSGPFILSQTTFPEYFIKTADEDLVENVEKDITLFAEKIAPCLNIKYRFVGEEPEDAVTNEYNMAMKRILPKNGIELVEIPRKEQSGRYISASSVRKCLEDNNMSELKKLVPESTIKILFGEMRQ